MNDINMYKKCVLTGITINSYLLYLNENIILDLSEMKDIVRPIIFFI